MFDIPFGMLIVWRHVGKPAHATKRFPLDFAKRTLSYELLHWGQVAKLVASKAFLEGSPPP